MPVYPISCNSCNHQWETFQSMKAPLPHCPACASVDVKRLIGSTSFQLKGQGWAQSGYSKLVDTHLGYKK